MKIKSLTLRNPMPDGEAYLDAESVGLERFESGFLIHRDGITHWQPESNAADVILEFEEPVEPEFECELCGEKKATAQALASHKRNKHKA